MDSIVLDNNIEYYILSSFIIDNIEYTVFSNINDAKDICVRKKIKENNEEFYIGLDDEKELNKALLHFVKENIK